VAAKAIGSPEVIKRANEVTSSIESGLNIIRQAVKGCKKPRVAFIEWHDPIFCGGHWIVDMLDIARGDYVMPVEYGGRSIAMSNEDFIKLDPDVILIGPCGFDLARTVKDTIEIFGTKDWWLNLRAVKEGRVFAADANSYYARPGPRLLQGTGIMAAAMHGDNIMDSLDEDLVPASGYCQITPDLYARSNSIEYVTHALSAEPAIPLCTLQPHPKCCLFVAWNGVIVLVYKGFPRSLMLAKERLCTLLPGLKDENFGSKWPKTTLAAVKDGTPDLTMTQFERLRDICGEYSSKIANCNILINVERLSIVEYERRGLEKLAVRKDILLHKNRQLDLNSSVSSNERKVVDNVVKEWSNLDTYLPKVNAPGSRISSYREASGRGSTCVAFLDPLPNELWQCLTEFQKTLNDVFPERYVWLNDSSLHCTLRSIHWK